MHYDYIIWDWNSTLLDDVAIAVDVINSMLSKRNLPLLTIEKYRDVFTFPIKKYYKHIGFDFNKERFEDIATEFIELYHLRYNEMHLFDDAISVLKFFQDQGVRQFILSAKNENELVKQVCSFNIQDYFTEIAGLSDHFANSKKERGMQLINEHAKNNNILFLGDTAHDYEIAEELGSDCILIGRGHQSSEKLKRLKCQVISSIKIIISHDATTSI